MARERLGEMELSALASRWRNISAAMACATIFVVSLGFTFPILTLILEARGVDAWVIGLNAAMTPVGLLLIGPMIPALAARFGARRLALFNAIAVVALLMLFKVFDNVAAWFVLRFLLGATSGVLFAISEAWVVRFADGPNRGVVLAIYSSLLAGGFAIGPFMIPITGVHGWLPFLIAALFGLLVIIPIAAISTPDARNEEGAAAGFMAFLKKAPVLLCAIGVFAFMDVAALTFLPVYGLHKGLSTDTAAIALGVLIFGNVILQLPIGYFADRWSKPGMMILCALGTAAGTLLIPAAMGTIWMWPLYVVVGATGFGIYTVALTLLGERFSGPMLVSGAAAFATMWALGAIVAAPASGTAMEVLGDDALPYGLTVVYLVYGLAFWFRQVTRHNRAR